MSEEPSHQAAALRRRAAARAIDLAIWGSLASVLLYLMAGLGYYLMDESGLRNAREFLSGWVGLSVVGFLAFPSPFVVSFAHEVLFAGRWGQTLGKRWLGVKVVRSLDGALQRAGFGRLFARWCVAFLPTVLAGVLAAFDYPRDSWALSSLAAVSWMFVMWLPVVLSRSRRGVHDWVAGTVVVEAPDAERVRRRGPGDVGFDRWQGFMRRGGSGS